MTNNEIIESYLFNIKLGFSSAIGVAMETLKHEGNIYPHHFQQKKGMFINAVQKKFSTHMDEISAGVEDEAIKNFISKWHTALTNRIIDETTTVLENSPVHPNVRNAEEALKQVLEDYEHYMRSDIK